MDVKVSGYSQTQILLPGSHVLHVSHFVFKEGSLVATDYEVSVAKPSGYNNWRNKRKETFLAGRLAVKHAQNFLSVPEVDIAKSEDGAPVWPNEYTGSISHTDNQAVAVLFRSLQIGIQYIGIDLEPFGNAEMLNVTDSIGLQCEFEILISAGVKKELSILLLFSLKESVYKSLYPMVGEFFDFRDVELTSCEGGEYFEFQVKRQLSQRVPLGFVLHGGYKEQEGHLLTWAYC
ncbi:4'-phosphopantetheinyl transferase EntD [Marinomonas foliarum]|uniref:Enterobactin synthase component D n=1 Tax=Marinomonas foliarum TaxID=491950 RepID=A0A368ZXG1_9GAMM|nr:4'-phosphopantetheinyl transferase EntD [Marinomonas foliarum]